MLGDSLRQKIDAGLAQSEVGVVILSHAFFAKEWPQRELDGLTARLMAGESNVVVPIWHDLTAADLLKYSPPLADLLAGRSQDGPVALATEIERVLARRTRTLSASPLRVPEQTPDRGATDDSTDAGDVHDATLDLLQEPQGIRLDQLMRGERHRFESAIEAVTADHINHHLDEATVRDATPRIASATDRRLASLLPLAMYRPDLLQIELRGHARWASSTELRGGGMTWQEAWRLPFWVLGMTLGALTTRLERFESLSPILSTTWTNNQSATEPFVTRRLGDAAEGVAAVYGPPPPDGQKWISSPWVWLAADISGRTWMVDRYPEWLTRTDEPQAALTEFDLLACIARSIQSGERQIGYWTLNSGRAEAFARQLHSDTVLRSRVAEAVGLTLESFDARAPDVVAEVYGLDTFARPARAAAVLRTGSW